MYLTFSWAHGRIEGKMEGLYICGPHMGGCTHMVSLRPSLLRAFLRGQVSSSPVCLTCPLPFHHPIWSVLSVTSPQLTRELSGSTFPLLFVSSNVCFSLMGGFSSSLLLPLHFSLPQFLVLNFFQPLLPLICTIILSSKATPLTFMSTS